MQPDLSVSDDSLAHADPALVLSNTLNLPVTTASIPLPASDFELPLHDPLIPIPLPPPPDDHRPLALISFGQNVPFLEERDQRLCSQIVNLSGRLLTADQLELLRHGLKFRCAPKYLPRLKLMAAIEGAFSDLSRTDHQQATWFRAEAARLLHHARPPKPNLSPDLLKAAKQLHHNADIVITSADKGGRIVILLSVHYAELCSVHLEDAVYIWVDAFGSGRFRVPMVDPRTHLDRELFNNSFTDPDLMDRLLKLQCSQLLNLLKKLVVSHDLDANDLRRLRPPQPYLGIILRFYALPK